MMKKKALLLGICALLLTGIAGCGGQPEKNPDAEYTVTPYWVDGNFLKTGDATLPPLVTLDGYKLYCAEGEQYKALLDSTLRSVPGELGDADTMITDRVQFHGVEVQEDTAYVDFVGEGLAGGSLEEGLLISQIVNSLVDSFEEVHAVRFLVDGEVVETLMGHYDMSEPYTEGVYN